MQRNFNVSGSGSTRFELSAPERLVAFITDKPFPAASGAWVSAYLTNDPSWSNQGGSADDSSDDTFLLMSDSGLQNLELQSGTYFVFPGVAGNSVLASLITAEI